MSVAGELERSARAAGARAGVAAETAIRIRAAVAVLPSSFDAITKHHVISTWESGAATRSHGELVRMSRLTNDAHSLAIDLAKLLETHAGELDRAATSARNSARQERAREAAARAAETNVMATAL